MPLASSLSLDALTLPKTVAKRNSGGKMSRKNLGKTLFTTVMRSSGMGRPYSEGPRPSSADSWTSRQPQRSAEDGRSVAYRTFSTSSSAQPQVPSEADRNTMMPSLAKSKQALSMLQDQKAEEMKLNGFVRNRAKLKADHKKYMSGGPEYFKFSSAPTAAAGPSQNRASASYGAPDLASSPSFAPPTPTAAIPSAPMHTAAPAAMAAPAVDELSDGEEFDAGVSDEVVRAVYKNEPPPDVHVVNTLEEAKRVIERLMNPALFDRIFACDTEVMEIDVTKHSPCCHGRVSCFSVYCGPDVDFSSDSLSSENITPARSMLWVDTWLDGDESRAEEATAIIEAFRPFWESNAHRKVWHNYSFDRHVIERLGLKSSGFDGDTMHMARLWDSSRTGRGGYSLEALTCDEGLMGPSAEGDVRGKVSMKKLFGRRNVKKDGTEGKLTVLPPVHEIQRSEDTRWQWVNYSAYDAKATWDLHQALALQLAATPISQDNAVAAAYARSGVGMNTLWDLYRAVWRPFGELLSDMESAGMAVDRSHLAAAEERAVKEESEAKSRFRDWATSKVPDAWYMNVGSNSQVTQLLFAGAQNRWEKKPGVPLVRTFKVPNQLPPEEGKKAKKNMDIDLYNVWNKDKPSPLVPLVFTPSGMPACSTPVLKTLAGRPGRARKALADKGFGPDGDSLSLADGLEVLRDDFEDAAPWSTDDAEISRLQAERQLPSVEERQSIAAENGYGRLYELFDREEDGLAACAAVDSLIDASAIDTLLSNFIVPLQSDDISKPDAAGVYRVHCSLNINTETGRLSARRPNLQNQPALEKDRYKVRKAFTADRAAGKTLIVADYGQLELRILAHMANCQSMINAFELGGDFHSRTALGMYDNIQRAVAAGDCLLEWDGGSDGASPPPVPLLKDMFGSERRKAKVLNFSIAYGKTAHGLSKDWGVSLEEAQETVGRWYSDRAEVLQWQKEQHQLAQSEGYVCTILGRRRQLPDAQSSNKAAKAHALRAAINTPIQGSAADVATAAMLRINANEKLRELGWRLLLQVHDEVILEGPKESAEEAQAVVVACMRSPFGDAGGDPLRVDLLVDSKYAETWYDAKEGFSQELRNVTAGPEEKKRMGEILMRLHRQQLEDENGGGSGNGASEEEDDASSEDEEELVEGLPLSRAILLADGSITLEDLSDAELAAFKRALAAGDLTGIVQPWQPWWTSEEAARLELSHTGTRLMEEVESVVIDNDSRNDDDDEITAGGDVEVSPAVPAPPPTALPPLSSLISKPPSPAVALHLLDLLYSYCLTLRLYNGQYNDDVIGAAETLLGVSAVLGAARTLPEESSTPAAILADCVAHACSADAGQGTVPRGFAVGVLDDVARMLELGRSVVVTALMDLSRLVNSGQIEAKEASLDKRVSQDSLSKKRGSKSATDSSAIAKKLKKAQQKLVFFLSWSNELPPPAYFALAAQAAALYEEQKAMLRTFPSDTVVLK